MDIRLIKFLPLFLLCFVSKDLVAMAASSRDEEKGTLFLEKLKRERADELAQLGRQPIDKQAIQEVVKKGIKSKAEKELALQITHAKVLRNLEKAEVKEDEALGYLRSYLRSYPINPKAKFLADLIKGNKNFVPKDSVELEEELQLFALLNHYAPAFLYQAGLMSEEELDQLPEKLLVSEGNKVIRWALNNPTKALEYYLDKDNYQSFLDSLLWHSAAKDFGENIDMLINRGANVNVTANDSKDTALMTALKSRSINTAKQLILRNATVNNQDSYGFTPLMCAVSYGRTDLVSLLLDQGAEVNVRDDYGFTALVYAAFDGRVEVARILLRRGADKNILNEECVLERVRHTSSLADPFAKTVRAIAGNLLPQQGEI
jgi:hypothetical protein